jgi:hypothetical protein
VFWNVCFESLTDPATTLSRARCLFFHCSADIEDARKHLADLHRLIPIIDWEFARFLLAEGRIRWFGRDLPRSLDQRLNPFRAVRLEQLREELITLAAPQDRP